MTERQVVKMMADEIVSAMRKINEENNLGYVDSKIRNTPALVNPDSLYSVLDANRIKGLEAYVGGKIENAEIDGSQITGIVNPSSISITTAQIQDLEVEVAEITQAEIKNANIDSANIEDLEVAVARILTLSANKAELDEAIIQEISAAVATMGIANIGSADIDFAQIKDIITNTAIIREGVGGKLYIDRLAVTEAQVLTLFTGELIMQGTDGKLYTLFLEDGEIKTEERIITGNDIGSGEISSGNIANGTITGDNIADGTILGSNIMQNTITGALITEQGITARELNVSQIFASEALIGAITAANIDVATLFASEAFIGALQTSIITGVSTEGNVPAQIELNKNISVNADNVYINAETSISQKVQSIDSDIDGLETQLKEAELKITDDAIIATVTNSETYKNEVDEIKTSISDVKQTAENAQGDIDTANTRIDSLVERVSATELKLEDDQIVMTVRSSTEYKNDLSDKASVESVNQVANGVNVATSAAQKAQETADNATSSLETAVSSVVVEYGLSDSRTEMTGNDWNVVAPEWTEDKYIWMRTATVLKNGTTVYSDETCISGADGLPGEPGDTGVGVSSIIAEYAVSTSKTIAPIDNWGEASPTWVNGSYIWTRMRIVYTSGEIVHTVPVCDSSWEAVNELDENIIHQGVEPTSPYESMLWLDTSSGIELKRYAYIEEENSYMWVTVSDTELSNEVALRYRELLDSIEATRNEVDEKLKDYATNDAVAVLREDVEGRFTVQDNKIDNAFTTVRTELVETASGLERRVVTIEDHVTIEPGARVTLSSSAASAATVINPEGVTIQDKSGQKLADFTSKGASVPKITIETQMSLGNLMWVVHSNKTSSIMAN